MSKKFQPEIIKRIEDANKKLASCKKIIKEIMVRRDKLRELYQDIEEICSSIDNAEEAFSCGLNDLECGIDHISELI